MKEKKINQSIIIVPQTTKNPLHKEQITFNRLSKKIEKLKQTNLERQQNADEILEAYIKTVLPLNEEKAKAIVDCAIALDIFLHQAKKMSDKPFQTISNIIVELLELSFTIGEPLQAAKLLYDKFNEVSFEEEKNSRTKAEKENMLEALNSLFGHHFSMEDLEDTPEAEIKLKQKIESLEAEYLNKNERGKRSNADYDKLKTKSKREEKQDKKEAERLAKAKEEENLQQKSIRSIYLDLVKLLHPDSEMNEEEKLWKQELMKEVTVAYADKNLMKLLDLEMTWLSKQGNYLATISLDKIKVFNSILQKQVHELTAKGRAIEMHPRYMDILKFLEPNLTSSKFNLKMFVTDLEDSVDEYKDITVKVITGKVKSTKVLIEHLEMLLEDEAFNVDDFINEMFFDSKF